MGRFDHESNLPGLQSWDGSNLALGARLTEAFSMREWFRDAMLILGVTFAGIQAFYAWRGSGSGVPTPAPLNHPVGGLIVVAVLFVIAGILNAAPLLRRLLKPRS